MHNSENLIFFRAIPEKNTWVWKTALFFFYPTTHGIQFPRTPTTHVIRKLRKPTTHRIQFFLRPSGVKFPIHSLALVKLCVRHVKCILSFREDKTRVKIQLVDLFHHKPDVYIRQLQVRMRIYAMNSPAACLRSLLWTPGVQTTDIVQIGRRIQKLNTTFLLTPMPVFGPTFAVQI